MFAKHRFTACLLVCLSAALHTQAAYYAHLAAFRGRLMKREQDEGSVISSGSGDRPPEVLQIHDEYANKVRGAGDLVPGCLGVGGRKSPPQAADVHQQVWSGGCLSWVLTGRCLCVCCTCTAQVMFFA